MNLLNSALIIIGVILGLGMAILAYKAPLVGIQASHKRALEKQVTELTNQCEDQKKITEEVSHEYQKKLNALNVQLARLKRVQPRCIIPNRTNPTPGHDGSAQPRELAGSHGISTEWLIDYAGEAERYRLQLISCQDYVRRISG